MRSATAALTFLFALSTALAGVAPATPSAASDGEPQGPTVSPQDPTALPQDPMADYDDVVVTPILHASLMLKFGDTVIQVDPTGRSDYYGYPEATIVLITDIHGDHFDREMATQMMAFGAKVVAPQAVADEWGGVDIVADPENEEPIRVADVIIVPVPAYNIVRGPMEGEFYHPPGRGLGYVVMMGGKRIYISGDTECTPEMRALEDIDIAFVCMNLPYTMTPGEAARCVSEFRPKVVYPYHHRGSDLDVFEYELSEFPEIEVRIEDWYPSRNDPRPESQ